MKLGIARTFQINQLFADLTPLETIGLAVSERLGSGTDWWRLVGSRPQVTDEVVQILEDFRLADVMHERTAILPYGKQRLLEIAVAVASAPRVLLLDEPAAGVPEEERHVILDIVAALPQDVTVLLIEHDMDLVFQFAKRISVLVNGATVRGGHAGGDRARPAREGGLSRRGPPRPWLICCRSKAFPPATARPWCCPTSASRSPTASPWPCSAATAPARPP